MEMLKAWSTLRCHVFAYRKLLRNHSSYLLQQGWLKSLIQQRPVDLHGQPLPWMNYGIIEFLKERLHDDLRIFEFGSGYSTLFYASRVKDICSVEHNADWYQSMSKNLPENATILYQPDNASPDYSSTIKRTSKKYDLVIVDGVDRVRCISESLPMLNEGGVLLLDDSHRQEYEPGIELGKKEGFKVLHFGGIKPAGWRYYRTSLFYQPNNCFGL